ncbi:MAG: alpha/beta hydrolase [Legionellaceae bacterium]|nr:alpha/beta hydrolase [Legionellaceae bacterium]
MKIFLKNLSGIKKYFSSKATVSVESISSAVKLPDGRMLGFSECGDSNGLPVFYFCGFPGSRLEAKRFHEVALSNGCRLIGIDRPGMGLSSFNKKQSFLAWANDVADFADCIGIKKFSIIGYSGGGPFATACAYFIPHRLNGLAIVSGLAPLDSPEARIGMARHLRVVNRLIQVMPWFSTVMMFVNYLVVKNIKNLNEKMLKQLPEVDRVVFNDPVIAKQLFASSHEAFRSGIAGPAQEMRLIVNPWRFNLEDIPFPVMIWQGALDGQVPLSHGAIYADSMPNAKLQWFEQEGHFSLIHNHIDKILGGVCVTGNR